MGNLLRLLVAYLNATINVQPKMQNCRLELTGLPKPGETCGLMDTDPGLAWHDSVCWFFRRVWNLTDTFLRSKPGPLAGYPDSLLTLAVNSAATVLVVSNCSPHLLDHLMLCAAHLSSFKMTWSTSLVVVSQ